MASPLPPATLLTALREGYGLAAAEVTRLPLGYDSNASVYRVHAADGADYFLKVRANAAAGPAGLEVPRFLHAQGVAEVLAPLPTPAGALWHPLADYALILYPFLHDAHPLPSGTADDQWRRFGVTLRRVHDATPPPDVAQLLRHETFEPVAVDLVTRLEALVSSQPAFDEPLSDAVAAAWRAHGAEIRTLLEQAEALSKRLRQSPPGPLRLCHADPHWDNVLVDSANHLWLVDWDDTLLAPVERDLMFLIGGLTADWATPRDTALFFAGYGPTEVDAVALAYFRTDWALQDIGEFARQVLEPPDPGEAARRDAARLFGGLFDPGAIVEKALTSRVESQ